MAGAWIYATCGRPELARSLVARYDSPNRSVGPDSISLAAVYGALGDTALAINLLERGVAERSPVAVVLGVDFMLDPLRDHPTFGRFAARSLGVRDRGAGALDLCYVACGRFDGYWEIDQSPWDIEAGGLIVEEAGGRMSDFHGGPFDIYAGETVASNARVHDRLIGILKMRGGTPTRHRPPVRRGRGNRRDAERE